MTFIEYHEGGIGVHTLELSSNAHSGMRNENDLPSADITGLEKPILGRSRVIKYGILILGFRT